MFENEDFNNIMIDFKVEIFVIIVVIYMVIDDNFLVSVDYFFYYGKSLILIKKNL